MTLEQALNSSDYSSARRESGGMLTVVEEFEIGEYVVTFGQDRMPPTEFKTYPTRAGAIVAVGQEATLDEWEPVDEDD